MIERRSLESFRDTPSPPTPKARFVGVPGLVGDRLHASTEQKPPATAVLHAPSDPEILFGACSRRSDPRGPTSVAKSTHGGLKPRPSTRPAGRLESSSETGTIIQRASCFNPYDRFDQRTLRVHEDPQDHGCLRSASQGRLIMETVDSGRASVDVTAGPVAHSQDFERLS